MVGIIAQLECDGKLGGEEVETTHTDTFKKLYMGRETKSWRTMWVLSRKFLFSFAQIGVIDAGLLIGRTWQRGVNCRCSECGDELL